MTTSADTLPEGCCKIEGRQPGFPIGSPKPRDVGRIDADLLFAIRACVWGRKPWPLVILGEAGSGKTCAGMCLIDYYGGWYIPLRTRYDNESAAPDMCQLLIDAHAGTLTWSSGYKRTVQDIWESWAKANVTVLDEVGVRGEVTPFHYETLKSCLDTREGRPTVIISNLTLSQLEVCYDDRIASRLSAGTVHTCSGDRRMEKRDDA